MSTKYQPIDVGIPARIAGATIEPAPRSWFEWLGFVVLYPIVCFLPVNWLKKFGIEVTVQ